MKVFASLTSAIYFSMYSFGDHSTKPQPSSLPYHLLPRTFEVIPSRILSWMLIPVVRTSKPPKSINESILSYIGAIYSPLRHLPTSIHTDTLGIKSISPTVSRCQDTKISGYHFEWRVWFEKNICRIRLLWVIRSWDLIKWQQQRRLFSSFCSWRRCILPVSTKSAWNDHF